MKTENLETTQFVDTASLLIYYGNDKSTFDYFEIEKRDYPIREKMVSSRGNNLYIEVYKPKNLPAEVFAGKLKASLASYGFSDVIVRQSTTFRKKNGLTRSLVEQLFAKVEFAERVLPVAKRGGKSE